MIRDAECITATKLPRVETNTVKVAPTTVPVLVLCLSHTVADSSLTRKPKLTTLRFFACLQWGWRVMTSRPRCRQPRRRETCGRPLARTAGLLFPLLLPHAQVRTHACTQCFTKSHDITSVCIVCSLCSCLHYQYIHFYICMAVTYAIRKINVCLKLLCLLLCCRYQLLCSSAMALFLDNTEV